MYRVYWSMEPLIIACIICSVFVSFDN